MNKLMTFIKSKINTNPSFINPIPKKSTNMNDGTRTNTDIFFGKLCSDMMLTTVIDGRFIPKFMTSMETDKKIDRLIKRLTPCDYLVILKNRGKGNIDIYDKNEPLCYENYLKYFRNRKFSLRLGSEKYQLGFDNKFAYIDEHDEMIVIKVIGLILQLLLDSYISTQGVVQKSYIIQYGDVFVMPYTSDMFKIYNYLKDTILANDTLFESEGDQILYRQATTKFDTYFNTEEEFVHLVETYVFDRIYVLVRNNEGIPMQVLQASDTFKDAIDIVCYVMNGIIQTAMLSKVNTISFDFSNNMKPIMHKSNIYGIELNATMKTIRENMKLFGDGKYTFEMTYNSDLLQLSYDDVESIVFDVNAKRVY